MNRIVATLVLLALLVAGLFAWRATHKPTPQTKAVPLAVVTPENLDRKPTLAEIDAIVRAACTGKIAYDKGIQSCSVCPQGSDDDSPQGDPPMPTNDSGWTYDGIVLGHFTSATASEAMLRSSGCESHASGLAGDFLLRRSQGTWSVVRYMQGGNINEDCKKIPWQAGRQALVCENSDMHQGVTWDAINFYTVEPSAPDPAGGLGNTFLGLSDSSSTCDQPHDASNPFQVSSIDSWGPVPGQPGMGPDIMVKASLGGGAAPATDDGECPNVVKQTYTLVFRNGKDHFVADPQNKLLKAMPDSDDVRTSAQIVPQKL